MGTEAETLTVEELLKAIKDLDKEDKQGDIIPKTLIEKKLILSYRIQILDKKTLKQRAKYRADIDAIEYKEWKIEKKAIKDKAKKEKDKKEAEAKKITEALAMKEAEKKVGIK